jgi:Arc/MetJ-type ribon-helix-helix transcriptional regulator
MLFSQDEGNMAMTINLPDDLERFLRAEVHCGHFASEEDALAEAVRLLRLHVSRRGTPAPAAAEAGSTNATDPVLGAMRDAADEMDDIVAAAMRHREQEPWRLAPGE